MARLVIALVLCFCFASLADIRVVVTVDWEGREISTQSMAAIQAFRKEFPDITMLHFLNAAYYTKPDADQTEITAKIKSVLQPGDEHGLHIHGWKSLFEAAGVAYQSGPTWKGTRENSCLVDVGHSVRIDTYSVNELEKVIAFSVETLEKQGFNRPTSFRAGGWMGSKNVLRAVASQGFTTDSSAVPAHHLETAIAPYLQEFVAEVWPKIEDTTQPHTIKLGPTSIVELPNNACMVDYINGAQILDVVKENAKLWRKNRAQDVYVTVGFHQETAATYLPRLKDAIGLIREYSKESEIPVTFATFPLPVAKW